ncbi:hypothetical protein EDB89DRAFT_2078918 [Lactarius sanguifluus]|nr:hypothetical protein EDB89DRAFT_2078918 [Lactarius sanguifluus]
MRDINRYHRIVEDVEIRLDDNDAILLHLWVLQLQEGGAGCILKDWKDPPPPESGLSPDSFVPCIQTKFQLDCFCALGNDFVSIDATHNTTQYAGLQLFTLLVRDLWGHGIPVAVATIPQSVTSHKRKSIYWCGMPAVRARSLAPASLRLIHDTLAITLSLSHRAPLSFRSCAAPPPGLRSAPPRPHTLRATPPLALGLHPAYPFACVRAALPLARTSSRARRVTREGWGHAEGAGLGKPTTLLHPRG